MSYVGERNSPRLERGRTAYCTMLLQQISELCSISAGLEKITKLVAYLLRVCVAQRLALNYVKFDLSEKRSVTLVLAG